ncbi:MAG TPA: hypothetical protein VF742_15945 [Terracidiphilus sp.]|jgi:hypothetical protein
MKYLVVLLLSCTLFAQSKHGNEWNLKKTLAEQGFSGMITGKVHFTRLGDLACNAQKFHAFYYEWEESNPPGKAIHFQARVLLINMRGDYAGSYVIEDRPVRITHNALVFPYEERLGNKIQCDADGWPESVTLNDQGSTFFK